jgi:phosphatidylglycerophosphate synthase
MSMIPSLSKRPKVCSIRSGSDLITRAEKVVETGEPIRRTSEIEEKTNLYFIHPLASRLVPLFAAMGISPNAVSLAGMAFGLLAAVAYYHYQDIRYAIAGFVLMIAWHVMDGADGQLARLTHAQSEFGKVLDGICDYVTFIAVYCALALALSRQYGDTVWVLAVAAGFCHAVQAAAYEAQRQAYNFWGRGQLSAELPGRNTPASGRFSDQLYRLYVRPLWKRNLLPPPMSGSVIARCSRRRFGDGPCCRPIIVRWESSSVRSSRRRNITSCSRS